MSINKDSQKAPNLRFKEFTDDWEQRELSHLVEINSGRDYKHLNSGTIPVYGTGGLMLFVDKALSYDEDGIGIGRKGTIDKPYILKAPFWTVDTLFYCIPKGQTNIYFGYAIFQKINWKSKDESTGVPSLSKKTISTVNIYSTKYKEQEKIGLLFKLIDDAITLHQRKLDNLNQLKEALLQQMFPGKGETVPKLWFAGFEDWKERKLGEASDVRDGTHASPKYINQGHPMVTSKNLTSSGLDMTDVSFLTDEDFNEINKRSKVSVGDILFGMIGTIGNPVIVDRTDFAIKNVALIKEKSYNPITNKWLLQYLKSPSFNQFIQKENAGGTQKFIALGLIRDMILKVPGLQEQQEIGTFLEQLDNTIILYQRKLDQIKNMKQVLLENMFV